MNLSQLRTEIRYMVRDTDSPYRWSDAILLQRINDAQSRVSALTKCVNDRSTDNIVAGTAEYALDTGFLSEKLVRFLNSAGEYVHLIKKTEEELDLEDLDWRSTSGDPTCYYIRDEYIGLYPKPDTSRASALIIDFATRPADLSDDTDIPFDGQYNLYPFHRIISVEVARICMVDEGESTKAQLREQEFANLKREIEYQLTSELDDTRIINLYESARISSRRSR